MPQPETSLNTLPLSSWDKSQLLLAVLVIIGGLYITSRVIGGVAQARANDESYESAQAKKKIKKQHDVKKYNPQMLRITSRMQAWAIALACIAFGPLFIAKQVFGKKKPLKEAVYGLFSIVAHMVLFKTRGVNAHSLETAIKIASGEGIVFDTVRTNDYILITHADRAKRKYENGIVVIPGANVSAEAAQPFAYMLAKQGFLVAIVNFPGGMCRDFLLVKHCIYDIQSRLMEDLDLERFRWTFVGHSMAMYTLHTEFAEGKPGGECRTKCIVFLGCTARFDFTKCEIPALYILGSNDGFASPKDFEGSKAKIARIATTFVIEGGNHKQFMSYEFQPWDNPARITEMEQLQITSLQIASFINKH